MNPRLRAAIQDATATLAGAGVDSPRTDAELLAAHVAGTERGRLALAGDPGDDFLRRYRAAVQTRAQRVPLQHITGKAAFGPVEVEVGPGVFIPRPETEALLEWAVAQHLPAQPIIVDLCTGSGALAIALASCHPGARVIAVDDDPAALCYARRNLESTSVELLQRDVTQPGLLPELDGTVDLVVANPPYIPAGTVLEPEVAEHDPPHALFGGCDGLAVITPILAHGARWLKAGGLIAVEHDDGAAEPALEILRAADVFDDVTARSDLAGRPRFVTARRTGPRSPR